MAGAELLVARLHLEQLRFLGCGLRTLATRTSELDRFRLARGELGLRAIGFDHLQAGLRQHFPGLDSRRGYALRFGFRLRLARRRGRLVVANRFRRRSVFLHRSLNRSRCRSRFRSSDLRRRFVPVLFRMLVGLPLQFAQPEFLTLLSGDLLLGRVLGTRKVGAVGRV